MYPSGNLQNSSSGERHAAYQHYSMSQVNNEKPVVQREHEEQTQTWGQPQSSPSSIYPSNLSLDKNLTYDNRLGSSSSSIFDRNNAIVNDSFGARDNASYQKQSYSSQFRGAGQSVSPQISAYRQQQQQQANSSSSYSKISNITSQQQQPGIQHFHDVPFYHGFKFQAIPGFLFLRSWENNWFDYFILYLYIAFNWITLGFFIYLGTSPFDMSAYVTSPSGHLENCEIV